MTDSAIVQFLIKENFKEAFKILDNSGGILYLNNTINKWLLSIFIQGTSELYSNFVWDLFLLEGNIIIFKAVYAMIIILEKFLKKYKSFDDLNNVFNKVPLNLTNRGKLAYYLIGKKFNFNMELIKKYRKTLTHQIIKEIVDLGTFKSADDDDEENNDKNNKNKDLECDLDWPQCINDKKSLEKEYDFIVLKQLEEPNVIDDYIDYYEEYKNGSKIIEEKNKDMNFINDDDIESQKIKYFKEERFKDLLIERKKHYCNSNLMSIRSHFNKNKKDKDKKKIDNTSKKMLNYIKEKATGNNVNETNERIDKIVKQVSKDNINNISFIKENSEKNSFLDDEMINEK